MLAFIVFIGALGFLLWAKFKPVVTNHKARRLRLCDRQRKYGYQDEIEDRLCGQWATGLRDHRDYRQGEAV